MVQGIMVFGSIEREFTEREKSIANLVFKNQLSDRPLSSFLFFSKINQLLKKILADDTIYLFDPLLPPAISEII